MGIIVVVFLDDVFSFSTHKLRDTTSAGSLSYIPLASFFFIFYFFSEGTIICRLRGFGNSPAYLTMESREFLGDSSCTITNPFVYISPESYILPDLRCLPKAFFFVFTPLHFSFFPYCCHNTLDGTGSFFLCLSPRGAHFVNYLLSHI